MPTLPGRWIIWSRAITVSHDRTAVVWDLATGTVLYTLTGHHDKVTALALADDGIRAVTASDDQTVIVWDLQVGQKIATWHGDAAMLATAWAPGEPIFAVGDSLGGVHILRLSVAADLAAQF